MEKFNKKTDKVVYDDGPNKKRFIRKKDYKDKEFLDRIREMRMISQDPEWYYSDENLTAPFAKFPFNRILGIRNSAYPATIANSLATPSEFVTVPATDYVVPGILRVDYLQTLGYSSKPSDPLNVAAMRNFAFMRRENSGSTNYEAPNLMMYNASVLLLEPCIKHAARALKVSAVYSPTSRYVPDSLITMMGFSPADIRKNFEKYRGWLNRIIVKFNQFPIPMDYKHIKRWDFLNDNIFMDRNSSKAQIYFYRPIGIPYFVDAAESSTDFQQIKYVYPFGHQDNDKVWDTRDPNAGVIDLEVYLNEIELALSNLYNATDISIMAGDTMKAFGVDSVLKIDLIESNAEILPVYSEMGIRQLHNTEVVPRNALGITGGDLSNTLGKLTITEEIDESKAYSYIVSKFNLDSPSPYQAQKLGTALLNIDKPNPDWKDVIELTRTKSLGTYNTFNKQVELQFASEVYLNLTYLVGAPGNNPFLINSGQVTEVATMLGDFESKLRAVSAFDWAPMEFIGSDSGGVSPLIGEMDNYVFVSGEDLSLLNAAIVQDLFGIK